MAVAALVIAVLALIASGLSVAYTKRQADAARDVADIERARHLAERTPRFDARIEAVNDGGWHRLWLRLVSGESLNKVEAEIVGSGGITFSPGQSGVDPEQSAPTLATVQDELASQAETAWMLVLPDTRPARLRLLVHAAAGHDSWDVPVEVEVPPDVAHSVW
jgi:hypothetical protein